MSHNHITPSYPWYNPSRISAWRSTGEGEAMARLLIKNRPLIAVTLEELSLELEIKSREVDSTLEQLSEEIVEVVDERVENQSEETEDEDSTLDVIETFLKCDNLRIVADEGEISAEVTIEVELEDIDDLVTEELAEIYLSQGLIVEAKAIYTRLSLLNSEKSVYFAELIEKIEQNN